MQEQKLQEIAMRIRTLREIMEIPVAEMAQQTGLSAEEYLAAEDGKSDFTFTFITARRRSASTSSSCSPARPRTSPSTRSSARGRG